MKTLVLNYHIIDNGTAPLTKLENIYAVSAELFVAQMELLAATGIPVLSLEQLLHAKDLPGFAVAITFDDGNPSDFSIAMPVLKKLGFPATFFLSLHNLQRELYNWKQVHEMIAAGFSIGAHGITHHDLTLLPKHEQIYELKYAKQMIEANTHTPVKWFALPYGMYNTGLVNMAQAEGYEALFATGFRLNDLSQNPFLIHRWALKRSTTLKEFEDVIRQQPVLMRKKEFLAYTRRQTMKLLGSSLTNRLNVFFQ